MAVPSTAAAADREGRADLNDLWQSIRLFVLPGTMAHVHRGSIIVHHQRRPHHGDDDHESRNLIDFKKILTCSCGLGKGACSDEQLRVDLT